MWEQNKTLIGLILIIVGVTYLAVKNRRKFKPIRTVREPLWALGICFLLDGIVPIHTSGPSQNGFLTFVEEVAGCSQPTGWVRPLEIFLSLIFISIAATLEIKNRKMKRPNHGLESTGAPPAAGTPETHP